MASRFRGLGWKASCVGLALFAGTQAGRAVAEETDKVVAASAVSSAVVDSLIEDAMVDGTISAEERRLILGQARRRLASSEVAGVEAKLASMPTAPTAMGTTLYGTDQNAADGKACCDEAGCGGHFDNLYIFGASDAWANPVDDDDANNFGLRFGFNMGLPVDECRGIGAQFGMSYGAYNFHGRDTGEESAIEDQIFLTAGVFKRADLCAECPDRISWGLVYDHLVTDNLGEDGWEIGIGQVRGQIGYALDHANEVGVSLALTISDDEVDGSSNDENGIRSLDQGNVYLRHKWCWGAETTAYIGLAEEPGDWVFGAKGEVPISNCVSLFGGMHYILPSTTGGGDSPSGGVDNDNFAEEIWNVSVGIAYYPGGNAVSKSVGGRRWMPLLPVADNGSFALDIAPDRL